MKRFTETGKWMDPWFRALSPQFKLAWLYVLDNCDAAGVISIDRPLADFQVGSAVDWDSFAAGSEGRLIAIAKGKHWVSGFIKYQYGELSSDCRAHNPAFASLAKHGLSQRVSEQYPDPSLRVQDKEKEKEQDKDKEGGCKGETETPSRFVRPTVQTVSEYALGKGYHFSPEAFVAHYESNGWRVGKNPMRSWRQACVTWEQSWKERQPSNGAALTAFTNADLRLK